LYFYRTRIVCHWIIYGYAPMIRSFVYRVFVSCIVRSFAYVFRIVRSVHFVRSFVHRTFVSCIHFVHRVFFVSFVWSVRSFFVRFVCVFRSFAFGGYCKLIRCRICKRKKNPKGQSIMDSPETLSTLVTQDTGRRLTQNTTQHRKFKRTTTRTSPKTGGETRYSRRVGSSLRLIRLPSWYSYIYSTVR
jgi:hypothetical protein